MTRDQSRSAVGHNVETMASAADTTRRGALPTLPFTALSPTEVFAVEDTTAQFTWRGLPDGPLRLNVHHRSGTQPIEIGAAGDSGAADIDGFAAGTGTAVDVEVDGQPITRHLVTTLGALDGPPIAKIATISDLHLGADGFGLIRQLREPNGVEPYPLRCAKAAVREAQAWGAELLVIKGDITELGMPAEWDLFDELLDDVHIPILAVPGNHDTFAKRGSLDATTELRRRGLFPEPVYATDIGGATIVMADSTVPGHSYGRLGQWTEQLVQAVDCEQPAFIFTHHHLEPWRYPHIWPPGIRKFDTRDLLPALFEANPDLVISSGHTHRNRAYRHATGLVTEVSATKDYPGVWAGYTIHASAVRQVVRRVAEPTCAAWNDRTHAVVGGIWGRWSPGSISDRSLNHAWTRTYPAVDAAGQVTTSVDSQPTSGSAPI